MPWRAAEQTIDLTCFGVPLRLRASRGAAARALDGILPPGAVLEAVREPVAELALTEVGDDAFTVIEGSREVVRDARTEIAIDVLDASIRRTIAHYAPQHVFVHAGAVKAGDVAVVVPGNAFSGKSTLVAALVRGAADYLSDDLVPIDSEGAVHPYPRRLALREEGGPTRRRVTARDLGGRDGTGPVMVGLVVRAIYVPGARWGPELAGAGRAALGLLVHTVTVSEDPVRALPILRRTTAAARILEGERGEADGCAEAILAFLAASG
jgi:hypothetical protein